MTLVHETEPEVEEGKLKQNRDAEDQDNCESGAIDFRGLLYTLRSIQWQKASAKGDDFA
jgi:dissimilatory sulfite reductase (desulfoviridin) alpha/beta subunit